MSEQYFTSKPSSVSQTQRISHYLNGKTMQYDTDHGVFSKERVDYGSEVLIQAFLADEIMNPNFQLCELGSGYGPITLSIATMFPSSHCTGVEINERAYTLSKQNTSLNNIHNVSWINEDTCVYEAPSQYDYVVTNPPIRAGKQVVHQFIRQAYMLLRQGGSVYAVIQKKQGAPSFEKEMLETFDNVTRIARDKGYWVLKSIKQ